MKPEERWEKSQEWFNLWIPETHRNIARFDPKPSQLPWVDFSKIWARNPYSVILNGIPGVGKTHLMLCMLRLALLWNPKLMAAYYKSTELDARLLAAMQSDGGDRQFIYRLRSYELLCIDDIGTETKDYKTGRASERIIRQYYDILDHRLDANLPTLLTSNLTIEQLSKHFKDFNDLERIGSRLQMFENWDIKGKDLRENV